MPEDATNFYLCDICLMRNWHQPAFPIGLKANEVRCYAYGLTTKRVMSDMDDRPIDVCSHWKPRAEVSDHA